MVSVNIEKINNGWIVETSDPLDIATHYFEQLPDAIDFAQNHLKGWDQPNAKD